MRALKGAYIGANLWAVGGLYDVIDFGPVSNTLEWWMRTAAAPGASLITAFVAHSRAASNQLHIIKGFVTARLGARRQAGLRSAGRCRTGNRLWVLCGGGRCGASCGRKESKSVSRNSASSNSIPSSEKRVVRTIREVKNLSENVLEFSLCFRIFPVSSAVLAALS